MDTMLSTTSSVTRRLKSQFTGLETSIRAELEHQRRITERVSHILAPISRTIRDVSHLAFVLILFAGIFFPESRPIIRHATEVVLSWLSGAHAAPEGFLGALYRTYSGTISAIVGLF